VVEVMPSSSTEGAVESTSSGSANRSASRPSANRIQNSLDGRPVGEPLNHPGSDADLNSTRSAMVATPNDPTGTPTQSDGGGSTGGAPSVNTGAPSANTGPPPSAVNAAAARTTSLPPCDSTASPKEILRPARVSDVRTSAGPAVPGRRKKPETTTGSGKGITGPSARRQMASMYPPLTAPLVPFHRPLSEAAKHPEESEATTRVSASNAYSPI
jgi:hypothetical protein